MFFETQQFDTRFPRGTSWADHIFRYCEFANILTEGADVDSAFLSCTIENCEWYWGLFNMAVFVDVKFNKCVFRGTAFSGSKFIDCVFTECVFLKDNLHSDCSFSDVAWYGCIQNDCVGLEQEFRSKR